MNNSSVNAPDRFLSMAAKLNFVVSPLIQFITLLAFTACDAYMYQSMPIRSNRIVSLLKNDVSQRKEITKHRIFSGGARNCRKFFRSVLATGLSQSRNGIEDSGYSTFEPIIVKIGDKPVLRIVPNDHGDKSSGLFEFEDVIIKPGFAWGEGAHPSTYMCLRFICGTLGSKINKLSFLDYGTGSGVLAIAAKRSGAGRVVGIDKDDEILHCAQENLALNFQNGDGGIELVHGRDVVTASKGVMLGSSFSATQFDLVVANMLPAALIRLAPTIANAVRVEDGVLALCGMRRDQVADVATVYERNGVRITEESSMIGSAPGVCREDAYIDRRRSNLIKVFLKKLFAGLPPVEWVLLRGRVPTRTAAEERARLEYLSDAAIG
jgi:precorrin-6B methylase 2